MMRNRMRWAAALLLCLTAGTSLPVLADAAGNPDEVYWFLPPDGYAFPARSRMVIMEKFVPYEQLPPVVQKYVAPERQKDGTRLQILLADLTGDHRDDMLLNTGLGGNGSENYAVFRMVGGEEQYVVVNASVSGTPHLAEEQNGWLQLDMVTGNPDQRTRTLYAYNPRTAQYEVVRQEEHNYKTFTCTVKKGELQDSFELDLFAVEFERRLHKLAQQSPQLNESFLRAEKMRNGFYRFDYRTSGKQGRAQEGFSIVLSSKGKWKRKIYDSCDLTTLKLYGIRPGKALYFHVIYTQNRGYMELLSPLIQPTFTFHVVNRNRASDQLNLRLTVDDKLITAKALKRDTTWFTPDSIPYPVQLEPGEHTLKLQAGDMFYEGKFTVDAKHDIGVAEVRVAASMDIFEKKNNKITFTCSKGPFED